MSLEFTEHNLLYASLISCLIFVSYLSLSQRQKDVVIKRLGLRGRRASSAQTPPRSLSPEKKASPNTPLQRSELQDAFPPSQRSALKQVVASLPPSQHNRFGDLQFDEETFQQSILGFEDDYQTAPSTKYSYSGFSVQEIRALGDFPDYATLSGVPLPAACPEFNIDTAVPRLYRPFRWAYHQTMSLTKMEVDWWLELENTYRSRIAERKALYAEHGEAVLQWLPGSQLACKELMEMALQFLCARYPQYFSLNTANTVLENKILGVKQNLKEKHPLLVLLDHVPEDFAVMLRNPETGHYHFRAGMICSALGWNVKTKIGLKLSEIHQPIPDYKEKMQFSMDRYFSKLQTFKPIQRGSWGLEVDRPLYMPPGHPHEKYREMQAPELDESRIHLRVDWQTLRRLPLSGAVIFNFKALFTPISEFRDEAYIPSLVLKVLKEGKESLIKYKGTWHVEHVVIPTMEAYEKEQKESGLIEADWEPKTLEESPWFPGWNEKWHKQQGF